MSERYSVWGDFPDEDEDDIDGEYDPDYFDRDDTHYTPSSTARDYSPSNPWDAPGMSIRDFI